MTVLHSCRVVVIVLVSAGRVVVVNDVEVGSTLVEVVNVVGAGSVSVVEKKSCTTRNSASGTHKRKLEGAQSRSR